MIEALKLKYNNQGSTFYLVSREIVQSKDYRLLALTCVTL